MSIAVHEQIETIESGYEYLLAYAAQGKDTDLSGGHTTSEVRTRLTDMADAASSIASILKDDASTFHFIRFCDRGGNCSGKVFVFVHDATRQ